MAYDGHMLSSFCQSTATTVPNRFCFVGSKSENREFTATFLWLLTACILLVRTQKHRNAQHYWAKSYETWTSSEWAWPSHQPRLLLHLGTRVEKHCPHGFSALFPLYTDVHRVCFMRKSCRSALIAIKDDERIGEPYSRQNPVFPVCLECGVSKNRFTAT